MPRLLTVGIRTHATRGKISDGDKVSAMQYTTPSDRHYFPCGVEFRQVTVTTSPVALSFRQVAVATFSLPDLSTATASLLFHYPI